MAKVIRGRLEITNAPPPSSAESQSFRKLVLSCFAGQKGLRCQHKYFVVNTFLNGDLQNSRVISHHKSPACSESLSS
eukprot:9769956-Alexandrium_andersonii.AAC.1